MWNKKYKFIICGLKTKFISNLSVKTAVWSVMRNTREQSELRAKTKAEQRSDVCRQDI